MKLGHLDGQLMINVVIREHFASKEGFGMIVPHFFYFEGTKFFAHLDPIE